jgi:hypothetical protein
MKYILLSFMLCLSYNLAIAKEKPIIKNNA